MRIVVVLVVVALAHAAIVIPLQEREKPVDEQRLLLEFLQEDEAATKPPATLLDSNFFGTIAIGERKQEFKVVFDTGSSVLWVYSDHCQSCQGAHKNMFSVEKSHTFHKRDIPFSIRYGTGESKGSTGTDEIFLADLEVHNQAFGQCEEPDTVMRNFPFDGIVGLSRSLISDKNKMPTIINTIKQEKLLEGKNLANSFSFYIGREEADPTYLMFGATHEMLEEDSRLHWTSVLNKNIYWEIPLDDIFIHPKTGGAHASKQHHALEEQANLRVEDDQFAAMGADPEMALLEVEAEVSAMEQRLQAHKKATSSKVSHRKHHAIRTATAVEAEELRDEVDARELEDRVAVRNIAHKSKSVATGGGEVGEGQLLSSLKQSPGQSMNPCTQDDMHMCLISVDSGHSLMSGPPDIIRPIKAALVAPNGGDTCTEEVMSTMPDISFAIGGKLFTLTPEDYLIKLGGKCVPAFSERNTRNGHDWVLGEHFMRTFYTVFDHDNQRIGLAHLDHVKPHLDTIMKTGSMRERPTQ